MTIRLRSDETSPAGARPDVIVVGIFQGADGPGLAPGAQPVDDALGGTLLAAVTALGATGNAEEVTKVATRPLAGPGNGADEDAGDGAIAPVVAAVGLGKPARADDPDQAGPGFEPELLRRAAGAAVRSIVGTLARAVKEDDLRSAGNGPGAYRIALALPGRDEAEAEAVALGGLLGGYVFRRYRTTVPALPPVELSLAAGGAPGTPRARALAKAITLVRDLVNTGPSDLVPATLADEAERVAAACGLDVEVLDEKGLAEGGYGGIMAVGQGSVHPPRLVRLAYRHPEADKTVVFAGKGITFDSGGLSLKPAKSMEHMKSDMAGAAAVLGAMQAIAELRPAVNVIGYLPTAENMPGGAAQRPADIIRIYGGKSVEVLNTDAEGRLVLADAIARAGGDSPDLIVDVATLTGAQSVALGRRIAGLMANDDAARDGIAESARRAGEEFWPMPLPEHLRRGLDSDVADLANVTGDRQGGMLVGGLFLRDFVPEGVPWAHLDIAGPAFNEDRPHGYTPKGGTGAAVRTLTQIAQDVADGLLL